MPQTEKQPTFQGLMDTAYARWQKGGDLNGKDQSDFISALGREQQAAVLLGNFNYQVCNGGFQQWIGNGYCVQIKRLINVIQKMPESPEMLRVLAMLQKLEPFIDTNQEQRGCSDSYIADEDQDEVNDICDPMDSEYYEFNEVFLDQVEAFLNTVPFPDIWAR